MTRRLLDFFDVVSPPFLCRYRLLAKDLRRCFLGRSLNINQASDRGYFDIIDARRMAPC